MDVNVPETSQARSFLPSGPYIPVDQIPNEIKRFFQTKLGPKHPQTAGLLIRPETLRALTLLTQVALVVFFCVLLLLIFCLVLICGVQLAQCCREKSERRKTATASTEKSRRMSGASAPPSIRNVTTTLDHRDIPSIVVASGSGSSRSGVVDKSRLQGRENNSLDADRSLTVYEEMREQQNQSRASTFSTSSSSTFGDYPDVPPALINRHHQVAEATAPPENTVF